MCANEDRHYRNEIFFNIWKTVHDNNHDNCVYTYVSRVKDYIYISSPFPFVGGDVLPATFSPPHLIIFSTLLCLFSSYSNIPPLLSSSHLSSHSPRISALASLVSSCPTDVTLPLSSVFCHPPSFIRVQPTVICSSPVSLSNSSALPSLPLTPPFFSGLPSLLLLFFSYLVVFAHLQPLLL